MSRRPVKVRREIPPDIRYNSVLVQRFINKINYQGKKNLAMKIVYGAFDIIRERLNEDPLKVFMQAIEKCKTFSRTEAKKNRWCNISSSCGSSSIPW